MLLDVIKNSDGLAISVRTIRDGDTPIGEVIDGNPADIVMAGAETGGENGH